MELEVINLVVVNEHTLGYINVEKPNSLSILHASIIRGSTWNPHTGPVCVNPKLDTIRLASKEDFDNYNIQFDGYTYEDRNAAWGLKYNYQK